ncbi:hypothetical protein [Filimonas effusa]|uniref:Tetratricopeptide repeat protein n=1 Tax=Filimonas effusa TaxID=2508721 RepID=A0A4Q1D846_9BACT|nr:hypothetical protein [Filimonas effusa]RXK85472.1 hypothetical protein ESB13_01220 [Filimonas effusa]
MKLIYTLGLSLILISSYAQRSVQEKVSKLSDSLTIALNSHIGESEPDYFNERRYISRILALDKSNECALYTQARILARARQYDSSIIALSKMISKKKTAWLLLFRGALFEIQGLTEKSRADYKAALDASTAALLDTRDTTTRIQILSTTATAKLLLGGERTEVADSLQQAFAGLRNAENDAICQRFLNRARFFNRKSFVDQYRDGYYLGGVRMGSMEPKHDGPIQRIPKP